MTVREYIGARYVPVFMGDWDITADYEPLSIVQYQGNSYTSRQSVPHGVQITNTQYWAVTGNYNAQVEAYRQEVFTFDGRITENAGDIADIQTTIGSSFDTSHTITDYAASVDASIADVQEIIGEGFSAENTIAQAITDEATAREHADEVLQSNINSISAKQLSIPAFDIHTRFVLDYSQYTGRSCQGGCAFKVNGTLYFAQWLASDDSSLVDWLLIVDAATGTVIKRVNLEVGHGQNLTYNPNTKELFVCGGTAGYYINVATPATASVVRAVDLPDIGGQGRPAYVAWDDATYNFFYVLKEAPTPGHMRIYKTDTEFTVISSYEINCGDYGQTVWQSIDVNNGVLYYANSGPENVQLFNVVTGERLNVINMPRYVNFLPIREIEWCSVIDGVMYVAQSNSYPGYLVPVVFAWDMAHGTAGHKNTYISQTVDASVTNRMQYVRVGWTRANLVNPFDTNNTGASASVPCFKFVEDAINYCKYRNISPRLSFTDDYPSYAVIEDMRMAMAPENAVEIGGLTFHNCVVDFVNQNRLTFTGIGASAIASSAYQHVMRFENSQVGVQGSSMWNVDLDSSITLPPSNGTFYRCWISVGQINDLGVAGFSACVVVAKANAHGSVNSVNGTAWLNG